MKQLLSVIIIAITLISNTSNHAYAGISRGDVSSLLGAAGGGILGSNIGKGKGRMVGAAVGALGGAAFGGWMGQNLDRPNQQGIQYHTQQPTYQQMHVIERHHVIAPQPVYVVHHVAPRVCREYVKQVVIGGYIQEAIGTACSNPDGSWQIVR